jgi:hypothetical protein
MDVGQTTVAKYMAKRRRPPSQGWRTFVHNHADAIASIDMFVVPTISFGLCMDFSSCGSHTASVAGCDSPSQCGMPCPSADRALRLGRASTLLDPRPRRRVWRSLHPAHPGHGHSRPTGLGGYAERVIGSIRRECLDHAVVVGEPVRRDPCRTGRVRSSPGYTINMFEFEFPTGTMVNGGPPCGDG